MAKGKHAAALFEVIHSGRYPNKPLMNTPKWWFKRNKPDSTTDRANGSETAAPTENDPTAVSTATLEAPRSSSTVEQSSSADPTHSHRRAHSMDMAVDSDRRQITFKFSYNSAIITGFSLLVILSLAFVVGRKMSRGPTPTIASETTEQLRAGPVRPDVLNVAPPPSKQSSTTTSPPPPSPVGHDGDEGVSSRPNDDRDAHAPNSNPLPQGGAPSQQSSSNRLLGLNYVIMQSFPEEPPAVEARDALNKAGVGATIERGIKGFPSGFIVVGTQGFARPSGTEYQAYMKKIEEVSFDLTRSRRGAKPFTPIGKKWDKAG